MCRVSVNSRSMIKDTGESIVHCVHFGYYISNLLRCWHQIHGQQQILQELHRRRSNLDIFLRYLPCAIFSVKLILVVLFGLIERKKMRLFFWRGAPFLGFGFIHFGASENNLGYLGLWDCSPYLHRHTNVDQLDSGIAVHSTDLQTKNQEY